MSEQWTNEQLDELLDVGLETLPMAELPAFFIQNTMRQIQPAIRFQLQLIDIALPVIGTIVFSVFYWLYLSFADGNLLNLLTSIGESIGWNLIGIISLELLLFAVLALYLWEDESVEWILRNGN
jgi:hypothetical protein